MNFSKRTASKIEGSKMFDRRIGNVRTSAIIPGACLHRNRGVVWIAGSLLAFVAISFLPSRTPSSWMAPVAEAQTFSQRTIQGKVFDDTGTRVQGATVFLKNNKTRNVKSFTSTSDGTFRFAQVGMVDDYDVWAEHANRKSAVKTVSSFDSRKQVEFELKLK